MQRTLLVSILALTLALTVAACGDDGMPPPGDGGGTDGGRTDAGPMDAAGMDTGSGDAGGTDAGVADAGGADAGVVDGGGSDAGATDTGVADAGVDGGGAASAQIAAVRATADGTGLDLPIDGATVTYVRGSFGGAPAGFFVQAQRTGPALFIAVDPASLTPGPVPGDVVRFVVEEMGTTFGLRQALAISGYTRVSSGADVSALTQDGSAAADLVTALDDYESESLSLVATVVDDFVGAGTGHVSAQIETAAITGNLDLRLRAPVEVVDALDLENGCDVTAAGIPMWRFFAQAQPHAWDAADLVVSNCPAPRVVGASAPDTTTVVVTFSRLLDAASVLGDGSQFSVDAGGAVAVSAASVTGPREVTLTTAAMEGGVSHTVTVAATVLDTRGIGVDVAFNAAIFTPPVPVEVLCSDGTDDDGDMDIDCLDSDCSADAACDFTGNLSLWEVDADTPSTDAAEFVEIFNGTGSGVDLATGSYYLLFVNGNGEVIYRAHALTGTIAVGAVFVAGSDDAGLAADLVMGSTNLIQNGADGVLLVTCATCTDAATDFPAGTVVTVGDTFTSANGATVSKVDALAYDTGDPDDPELMSALSVSTQFDEAAGGNSATESLQRTSRGRWNPAVPTPGTP